MAHLQRRLQILLSDEHYALLESLSVQEHCSIAELLRRAIDRCYLPSSRYRALASLKRLEQVSCLDKDTLKKIYNFMGVL